MRVDRRFTKRHPCPVCGGHDAAPRGKGMRCYGFLGEDGGVAHCTREEHAGALPRHPNSETYAHRLGGDCPCGGRHADTPSSGRTDGGRGRRIVAVYHYRDERGNVLFEVVRYEPKDFKQRRPDGRGGYVYRLGDVRRVIYRLRELLAADPASLVYVVEGEKDADRLGALGFVATTNPGGAGKWRAQYNEVLRARHVVILPDNDKDGRDHAEQAARSLHGIAASTTIVTLVGLPEKGDVSDWLAAGGTREQLERLVTEAGEHHRDDGAEVRHHQHLDGGSEADAEEFFDAKGFVPARLGARLTHECQIRLGHDRRLWRYVKGVYRPDGDDWARQRTREFVGERFRRNHLEEVTAWLRAQLPTLGHTPPREYINCKNGLLDWRTGTLKPHSPDVLSTNQIPVGWNPEAAAPTFARFLSEVLPDDAVELAEELAGYALYPGNPFRKAVMLLGPGGNGKSVWLRLIAALLGEANIASVPLQALGEDRFSAADLFGKLANICGDLDARAIQRTDLFKQVTGGDPIRGQHKFRDAFTFVSYALPLFSANEPPRTADQTDAWFDRWIIVPMPRRFEGTPEEDTGLSEKLAAEIEGVLVRAVAGLQRLMARGRFAFPASVERAREQYRQTLDTVRAFITEECHFDRDEWVDRADLYRRYKEWCRDGGRYDLAATTFNARLLQAYPGTVSARTRRGRPGWLGLAIGGVAAEGDAGDEGDGFDTLTNRVRAHTHAGVSGNGVTPVTPVTPPTPEPSADDAEEVMEWRR